MALTHYSQRASGNYWALRFDYTGGYVGISEVGARATNRVLLSPSQYASLLAFVARHAPSRQRRKPGAKRRRTKGAP